MCIHNVSVHIYITLCKTVIAKDKLRHKERSSNTMSNNPVSH